MNKLYSYFGLKEGKQLSILAVATFVAVAALTYFSGRLGNLYTAAGFVILLLAWWVLARLDWKQIVLVLGGLIGIAGLGRYYNVWSLNGPDYFGLPIWIILAAAVSLFAVIYLTHYLASMAFSKWDKLEPKQPKRLPNAKQMANQKRSSLYSEIILIIGIALTSSLLGTYNYFLLGMATVLLFMRWFVSNNWERSLLFVSTALALVVVYFGVKLNLWGFLNSEFLSFPLWIPVAVGLYSIGLYRIMVSVTPTKVEK